MACLQIHSFDPLALFAKESCYRVRADSSVPHYRDTTKTPGVLQIEHTRHRSFFNFLANLLCGLIAYCHQPKKPFLGLGELLALVAP
jgi:hypothetical protein